jgi:hypothetical protein
MNWLRIATGPPRWDEVWIRLCTYPVPLVIYRQHYICRNFQASWNVMSRRLLKNYHHFEGSSCSIVSVSNPRIAWPWGRTLKIKTTRSFGVPVTVYQSTQHHIPQHEFSVTVKISNMALNNASDSKEAEKFQTKKQSHRLWRCWLLVISARSQGSGCTAAIRFIVHPVL